MCVSKLCVEVAAFKSEPRQKHSLNKALVRLRSFATVAATSSQMQSLITSLLFLDVVMKASLAIRIPRFLVQLFESPTSECSAWPTEPMSIGNASEG